MLCKSRVTRVPFTTLVFCVTYKHVGARQAKKDSPLENPMVDRSSQVLVLGSVLGTLALAAVSC